MSGCAAVAEARMNVGDRAVVGRDASQPPEDLCDVRPEHSAVVVTLVDHDEAKGSPKRRPAGMARQHRAVKHVRVGQHVVGVAAGPVPLLPRASHRRRLLPALPAPPARTSRRVGHGRAPSWERRRARCRRGRPASGCWSRSRRAPAAGKRATCPTPYRWPRRCGVRTGRRRRPPPGDSTARPRRVRPPRRRPTGVPTSGQPTMSASRPGRISRWVRRVPARRRRGEPQRRRLRVEPAPGLHHGSRFSHRHSPHLRIRRTCASMAWTAVWSPGAVVGGGVGVDLSLDTSSVGESTLVAVGGEIDVYTAPKLRGAPGQPDRCRPLPPDHRSRSRRLPGLDRPRRPGGCPEAGPGRTRARCGWSAPRSVCSKIFRITGTGEGVRASTSPSRRLVRRDLTARSAGSVSGLTAKLARLRRVRPGVFSADA